MSDVNVFSGVPDTSQQQQHPQTACSRERFQWYTVDKCLSTPLVVAFRWLSNELLDAVDAAADCLPHHPYVPVVHSTTAVGVMGVASAMYMLTTRFCPQFDLIDYRSRRENESTDQERSLSSRLQRLVEAYRPIVPSARDLYARNPRASTSARFRHAPPDTLVPDAAAFDARVAEMEMDVLYMVITLALGDGREVFLVPSGDVKVRIARALGMDVRCASEPGFFARMIGFLVMQWASAQITFYEHRALEEAETTQTEPQGPALLSTTSVAAALAGMVTSPDAVRRCLWKMYVAYDTQIDYSLFTVATHGAPADPYTAMSMANFLPDDLRQVYMYMVGATHLPEHVVTATYQVPLSASPSRLIAKYEALVQACGADRDNFAVWRKLQLHQIVSLMYAEPGQRDEPAKAQSIEVPICLPNAEDDDDDDDEVFPNVATSAQKRGASTDWAFSTDALVEATALANRVYVIDQLYGRMSRVGRGAAMLLTPNYAERLVRALSGRSPLYGLLQTMSDGATGQTLPQPPPWVLVGCVLVASVEGMRFLFTCMLSICDQIENVAREVAESASAGTLRTVGLWDGTAIYVPTTFFLAVAWLRGVLRQPRLYERIPQAIRQQFAEARRTWATMHTEDKARWLSRLLLQFVGGFRVVARYLSTAARNEEMPPLLARYYDKISRRIDGAIKDQSLGSLHQFIHTLTNPLALAAFFAEEQEPEQPLASAASTSAAVAATSPSIRRHDSGTNKSDRAVGIEAFWRLIEDYDTREPVQAPESMRPFFDALFYTRPLDHEVLCTIAMRMRQFVSPLVCRIAELCVIDHVTNLDVVEPMPQPVIAHALQDIAGCDDRHALMCAFHAQMTGASHNAAETSGMAAAPACTAIRGASPAAAAVVQ